MFCGQINMKLMEKESPIVYRMFSALTQHWESNNQVTDEPSQSERVSQTEVSLWRIYQGFNQKKPGNSSGAQAAFVQQTADMFLQANCSFGWIS